MNERPASRTVLHVFPTFDVGGSQMRFATLANRLGRRYRHVILAIDNRHGAAELLGPDVDYTLRSFDLDKRNTIGNLPRLRRIIRDSGADQLFTYNWGATEFGLANLIGGIPHVHVEDGFGPEETRRQLPRRIWFRRMALARATAVVLPSRKLEEIALKVWGFPRRQVAYIPNGVDCDRFARAPDPALCQRLGLDRGTAVVGTVAGLRPEKNVGRLIRAFSLALRLHEARLAIIGAGVEEATLKQLARDLGIEGRVVFAGQIRGVERLLGALDVYGISSDTEQMPISLIEAMAAGLPVASVDVGDIAVMLSTENRPYVTPVEDSALADALSALLANPSMRKRIGAANAARARSEYDEASMVAAYDALYAGAVPGTNGPSGKPTP